MRLAIDDRPGLGPPPQLCLLLHGEGADGTSMRPLADALRAVFPAAAIIAPDAPLACDGGVGHQWFPPGDLDDRAQGLPTLLPALADWVRATQQRTGAGAAATSLAGFSQGAIVALELAQAVDGLAGRVLAFGGRYARPPAAAPRATTLHLLHGGADGVIPAALSRQALQHLAVLHGDATLDVAESVGHELHPALIDSALHRLRTHIPHRTWQAALGAAAPITDR